MLSFLALILVGTAGLLWLPGLYTGPGLTFSDALFMATSAVCVTGLIVVDTATYFTIWGQLWILVLIQLGGLGLIGMTSVIIGALGRRLSLRTEVIAAPSLEHLHGTELQHFALSIVRFTFIVEAVFAAMLWLQWRSSLGDTAAAWHAVFHAVSAFCNAGFSTFSDSLMGFADSPGTLLTVSLVIIIGGFGYLSTLEVSRWARGGGTQGIYRLSSHSYAALTITAVLLAGGMLLYAFVEWNGVLAGMGPVSKLTNAWFMSTTARTAGFNSVDYGQLTNQSALVTIALMAIGGSPGSTAGGVKTTALAILIAMAWSRTRGRQYVSLRGRSVPDETVERTVSLFILFFLLISLLHFVLSFTETGHVTDLEGARATMLPLLFEAVSAAGTVGLSMGTTAELSTVGKLVIVVTMFIGRVGPLAFFAAVSFRKRPLPLGSRPAREDVIVG